MSHLLDPKSNSLPRMCCIFVCLHERARELCAYMSVRVCESICEESAREREREIDRQTDRQRVSESE